MTRIQVSDPYIPFPCPFHFLMWGMAAQGNRLVGEAKNLGGMQISERLRISVNKNKEKTFLSSQNPVSPQTNL